MIAATALLRQLDEGQGEASTPVQGNEVALLGLIERESEPEVRSALAQLAPQRAKPAPAPGSAARVRWPIDATGRSCRAPGRAARRVEPGAEVGSLTLHLDPDEKREGPAHAGPSSFSRGTPAASGWEPQPPGSSGRGASTATESSCDRDGEPSRAQRPRRWPCAPPTATCR